MDRIAPIKLQGIWNEGYALDYHIISSIPMGEDNYGRMRFDTTRTPIGELIYQFKYKANRECLEQIIDTIEPFIISWLLDKNITFVLPTPPTRKERSFQPVFEIARNIAYLLNANYDENILVKKSNIAVKDLNLMEKQKIESSIIKTKKAHKSQNILLVDDLFQSGATLTECVKELRKDPNICKIYVLTMTKTKGE